MKDKIKEHWDIKSKEVTESPSLIPLPYMGTYSDYNMQHLEMKSILKYIKEGDSVLDLGCGRGYTSLYFAWKKEIFMLGVDYSKEMIEESNKNMSKMSSTLIGEVSFKVGDVLKSSTLPQNTFDVVYTERCLINLESWEDQKKAIKNIMRLVKPNGYFIMQEGSKTSLNNLNVLRKGYDLKPIEIVWHNLYFDDDKVKELPFFVKTDDFSSTFTFISRALHPALIYPKDPSYKATINKLALDLPNYGDYGYQKIYVFKKPKTEEQYIPFMKLKEEKIKERIDAGEDYVLAELNVLDELIK